MFGIEFDWIEMQLVSEALTLQVALNVHRHLEIALLGLFEKCRYCNLLLDPNRTAPVVSVRRLNVTSMVHHPDKSRTAIQRSKDVLGQSLQARLILGEITVELRQFVHGCGQGLSEFDFLWPILAAN